MTDQPVPLGAPLSPAEADEARRVSGLDLDEIERLCQEATPGPWLHRTQRDAWNTLGLERFRDRPIHDDLTMEHQVVTEWIHGQAKDRVAIVGVSFSPYREQPHRVYMRAEDAEFIAESRTAVPSLVARVRELTAALELATDALRSIVEFEHPNAETIADDALIQISVIEDAALRDERGGE